MLCSTLTNSSTNITNSKKEKCQKQLLLIYLPFRDFPFPIENILCEKKLYAYICHCN